MKADRLLFVDGLRGIAASSVVLYHLLGRTDAGWVAKSGYLGVALFFVLSGYVITMMVGTIKSRLDFCDASQRDDHCDPILPIG